ncbi:MAG: DUF4173 domain-containing protein [Chryseobacterium sp.]|nr:MAG: DUF4173 domain-containing protein [Chryseobacterium sp.]
MQFTLIKIQKSKTNAYLFTRMFWVSYGLILVCSYVNWGAIITSNNIKNVENDPYYYANEINYNEKILLDYAVKTGNSELKTEITERIKFYQKESILSKILYYETIDIEKSDKK